MAKILKMMTQQDGWQEQFFPITTSDAIIDIQNLVQTKDYNLLLTEFAKAKTRIAVLEDFKKNNTGWTTWTKTGIELSNGAQPYGSDDDFPQYRTRVVNGDKEVEMSFRLKNLTTGGDTTYVKFPAELKPNAPSQVGLSFPMSNGRKASWVIGDGVIMLHATSDNTFDQGFWYPFTARWSV
ncbi:hypothetical protein EQZ98_03670 [Leuconostoc mesenteroides]|uniref:hypothetical protein n=1 Tax=Leuconostoc mesenteroides TaxID=1245 RepID=UPI000FFE0E5A|nr:hypothetical protein [Leuconostoc mesenteroides]QAT27276.1 hypothetical protein EQZ98_03670 [Leuconostoc mesenteroides]